MALEFGLNDMASRYEVWGGIQVVREPSSLLHEEVLGRMHLILQQYVGLHGLGRVFLSNAAVYVQGEKGDFVMPDLTYVSNEKKHLLRPNGIFGAPDLTVEIVSPGLRNTKRDAEDKFKLYERHGVREYWMIDYIEREIYLYGWTEGRYEPIAQSAVLPGIELAPEAIFDGLDEEWGCY